MFITGLPWCDYVACNFVHEDPDHTVGTRTLLQRVFYDDNYVNNWMRPRLEFFSKCLENKTCPPKDLDEQYRKFPAPPVKIVNLLEYH